MLRQELVSSRQFSRKWRTAFSKGKLEAKKTKREMFSQSNTLCSFA
jgi:hypothetical protein